MIPEKTALELAQRRWQRLPDIDPVKEEKKRVIGFFTCAGDLNARYAERY